MRSLKSNQDASAVPLILFFVAIFVSGALYTLFMIEIGFPTFSGYIPSGDAKTFIMMVLYALPLMVLVVGVISLVKAGLKRSVYY